MKLLVSVRTLREARLAAAAGVHFIDLKEPALGALGGLPPELIADVVAALRRDAPAARISATIGDWPADALAGIAARVQAVAACGVDYVKVGVPPRAAAAGALVQQLALLRRQGVPLVPVLLADDGVPPALLDAACGAGFPALMLDTQAKRAGSLLALRPETELRRFVRQVQASGTLAGLAGALRASDWPALAALAPDFAGFRSAVCAGDRAGELQPELLAQLVVRSVAQPVPVAAQASVA